MSTAPATAPSESSTRLIRRRITAHIAATPLELVNGGVSSAVWQPAANKAVEMFGCANLCSRSLAHNNTGAAILSGVRLVSCELLETHSTFPMQLGVSITSVPPTEASSTAHAYAFTTMPNAHNPTPSMLYEAGHDDSEQAAWREQYPRFSASNIDTLDTLTLPNESYLFIDKNHPVVEILRQNKDLLNKTIDQSQLFDGRWYKVGRPVFNTCCDALKARILNNIATCDLNHFSLQIHQIGDKPWGDWVERIRKEHASPEDVKRALNTQHKFSARIEIKFEVNPGPVA